jgi:hypothetical protein
VTPKTRWHRSLPGVGGRVDYAMTMRDAWSEQAEHWLELVGRELDPGWTFGKSRFLDLVPAPGRLTLDVGCGEGRWAVPSSSAGTEL